ncbi:hypothetical protein BDK51DRAFT_46838 [Blyttiomyces helicus]|uniref:Uncharacterized protein n=1 Tax=Blyttiomyces helicus TaxID=388810 RepID=A0A4V1IR20_9FUNG|nr:hypothetical protein BDK51DRAFT_46838 [Blyttiomyces helicus]|eukprot:RKO88527.1 hypothetical protein BDK51DRAFT_46838 [Blyttiomyces helicus]
MVVDYSRFANVDVSDDEDEAAAPVVEPCTCSECESLFSQQIPPGSVSPSSLLPRGAPPPPSVGPAGVDHLPGLGDLPALESDESDDQIAAALQEQKRAYFASNAQAPQSASRTATSLAASAGSSSSASRLHAPPRREASTRRFENAAAFPIRVGISPEEFRALSHREYVPPNDSFLSVLRKWNLAGASQTRRTARSPERKKPAVATPATPDRPRMTVTQIDGHSIAVTRERAKEVATRPDDPSLIEDPEKRAEAYKQRGNQLLGANHTAEAIESYGQAITLAHEIDLDKEKLAVFYSNRSAAHARFSNYGSAIQDAQKVIELSKGSRPV